ncbi:MAG: DegV family protein [Pseudomonadota bacterium]
MQYLDGEAMRDALKNGVQRVIASQDGLNRINVFPVADGDTGTNLALTVGAMGNVLHADGAPLHKLLARAADALLDGARGNSGAILAQFFQGVSDTATELTRFSAETFASAMVAGSTYARDALSEPREGTILSVIDAFADALTATVRSTAQVDFPTLIDHGLHAAEKALALTKTQLAELRKADVVDAGAKGFVALLQGMQAYIKSGETVDKISLPDSAAEAIMAGEDHDLDYRYCTECIITGDNIDRRKLREALSELGGSLVLAGSRHKAKIHIHVNEPDAVFRLARDYGTLTGEKADDMQRQQHATHVADRSIAVITDSAADIAPKDMDALDIHFVPLRIQFGEQGYLDKLSISESEFFAELTRNPAHPTSSQPAPGDFRRQYQFLASHYPHVVAITLSAKVSGTYSAAQSAASRVSADGDIHVIDSRNASLGEGLIVREAAEKAATGADIDAVLAHTRQAVDNTKTFALVSDLTYAVRGGRVPKSRKLLADFLRLNAILTTAPDGSVGSGGAILGRRNRVAKFTRKLVSEIGTTRPVRLAVGHAACEAEAVELENNLTVALPNCVDTYRTEIGSAFGVHGGPGLLVVSVLFQQ